MKTKPGIWSAILFLAFAAMMATNAWANIVELQKNSNGVYYINMPKSGVDTLNIPANVTTFKVYDDGGGLWPFSSDCDGHLVIIAPEDRLLRFSGNLFGTYIENSRRYAVGALIIWDGIRVDDSDEGVEDLFWKIGDDIIPNTLSSGNSLTFHFWQYNSRHTSTGIDVSVTLVDANAPHEIVVEDVSGGNVVCDQTEANTGASVTLTAVADDGYVLDHIEIIDERRHVVEMIGGTWLTGNEATFTMPNAAVTIIPKFVSEDEGPHYIYSGDEMGRFIIPEGVKSFVIEPLVLSSEGNIVTLVLTAPDGYLIRIDNTNTFHSFWFAYEGDVADYGGDVLTPINGYASIGNTMTIINYESRTEAEEDILPLHISIVEANVAHSIYTQESDCGSVVSNLESAMAGTTVTLTATPNEGCMLAGIKVFDVKGEPDEAYGYPFGFINVTGGAWYTNNEGSFKMPYGDVVVIPYFIPIANTAEENLFIAIPEKDTVNVELSAGVSSLKVYDYRGPENVYGNNNDGYLILTAPEGYKLHITEAKVETIDESSYLSVRDGSGADAQEILKMWGMEFEREGNEPLLPLASSGRTLTFHFKSDDRDIRFKPDYDWGWPQELMGVELMVEVYDPNKQFYIDMYEVSEGDAVSDLTNATAGQMVTVTATPNNGYVFKGVAIYDAYTGDELIQVTDGAWYNNSVKFAMPNRNIGIYPYFEKTKNAEIAIPRKDTIKANIPDAIKKIYVHNYDGSYSNNNDGTLTLTAPEGCILFTEWGSISIYDEGDSLIIYDGSSASDDKLAEISAYDRIGELRSTGRSLTFHFKSDSYGNSYGAEIWVGVTGANGTHRIASDDMWSGHVTFSKNMAAEGDTVVVTAVPDDDYVLSNVWAKWYDQYDNEYPIDIIGGTWYNNEAKFVMPAGDVEVSARFYEMENNTFYAYIPESDALTANIPEGMKRITVYNNREFGEYGDYFNNSDGSLTLVAPEGHKLFVDDISFAIADEGDSLVIFDGADTNQVRLAKISLGDEVGEIRSTGQSLTFQFKSNDEGTAGGVYIDVGVVNVSGKFRISLPDCNNGSITVDKKSALEGDTVTITANPKEGYLLSDLEASWYDSESGYHYIDVAGGTWYNNEAKFVMPAGDVKISAYFDRPENGSYYVAIPQTDTLKLDIPEGMKSIVIYSDYSYIDWLYYSNSDGVLVLTAPEGYKLVVAEGAGDISDEGDSLIIYAGDGVDAERELATISVGGEIGELENTGRSLTFKFKSDGEGNGEGVYAKVRVVDVNEVYSITLAGTWNGNMISDKLSATVGDTVTLVATPDEGYLLNYFTVDWEDFHGSWNSISPVGGTWYSGNEAKFVMPRGDVLIYAEFRSPNDYLRATIPTTDTVVANIPEGIRKLTVRTACGWAYCNNNDGVLVLTAPEGYSLRLSGNTALVDEDSLFIYDGAGTDAKVLAKMSNNNNHIDYIYSTGRSLAFQLKSNENGNDEYPELSVDVLKKSGSSAVAVYELYNGYKFARIDGLYDGKDTVNIEEDMEVNNVEFIRNFAVTANDSGKYSTIVFPFDFNASSVSGLDDILEFSQMIEEDGKLKVQMSRVWCRADVDPDRDCSSYEGNLKANTPYMLKMTDETLFFNGSNYTIKRTEPAVATSGNWQFIGTYAYKKWEKGDTDLGSVYGFAATASNGVEVGQFVKAGSGAYIRPMRAYLKYSTSNGEPRPAPAGHVSVWRDRSNELPEEIEVVVVEGKGRASIESGESGSEKKTTVIGRINTRTGEFTPVTRTYDLKGRSLNAKPKAKGVYVEKKR